MILAALAVATAAAVASPPPIAERMPNLYREPGYCRAVVEREVARQMTAFKGQRPPLEYAVMRKLDGCSVPTPVGYHPNQEPGAADPTAKREDAPSNRR
jgi:hypothetical protein